MSELTEIQRFFKEKTIFITGGTGLIGKCLVEKLLRSCYVKYIFIILRENTKKTFGERSAEYFNDVLFTKVKNNDTNYINKIRFLNGDISIRNFGLSPDDYKMVIERTNIMFHAAATTKFSSPLHEAVPLNIVATKTVLAMAKEMKNLEVLVHVSTAYAFSNMEKIDETVQSTAYKPEFLIDLVNNMKKEDLDKITPTLLGNVQNTYLLTKQTAECLIVREQENIPISIYRPVSVSPAYREPIPGWTNNNFAAFGFGICIALGATKVVYKYKDTLVHMIPVDLAANCMLAIAWHTALHREKVMNIYNHYPEDKTLYNIKFANAFVNNSYPLECAFRNPGYIATASIWIFNVFVLFVQTIPNIILDMVLILFGKKSGCYSTSRRLNKMTDSLTYFGNTNFNFETNNLPALWKQLKPIDKEIFNFDWRTIDWDEYLNIGIRGVKEIIFKENMNNIDKANLKHKL